MESGSQEKNRKSGKRISSAKQAAKNEQKNVVAGKQSSLVGLLPLDVMAGPTMDEFEASGSASAADNTNNTIISGVNLIDTVVLDQSDIVAKKQPNAGNPSKMRRDQVKSRKGRDSCDIEAEDSMEGMIGGNFNTFGE